MAVVGVAIVGGVDRDNGLQMRRPMQSYLQGRKPAVRSAVHSNIAIRPGLPRQPLHRVVPIFLLLG